MRASLVVWIKIDPPIDDLFWEGMSKSVYRERDEWITV